MFWEEKIAGARAKAGGLKNSKEAIVVAAERTEGKSSRRWSRGGAGRASEATYKDLTFACSETSCLGKILKRGITLCDRGGHPSGGGVEDGF